MANKFNSCDALTEHGLLCNTSMLQNHLCCSPAVSPGITVNNETNHYVVVRFLHRAAFARIAPVHFDRVRFHQDVLLHDLYTNQPRYMLLQRLQPKWYKKIIVEFAKAGYVIVLPHLSLEIPLPVPKLVETTVNCVRFKIQNNGSVPESHLNNDTPVASNKRTLLLVPKDSSSKIYRVTKQISRPGQRFTVRGANPNGIRDDDLIVECDPPCVGNPWINEEWEQNKQRKKPEDEKLGAILGKLGEMQERKEKLELLGKLVRG